MRQTLAIFLDAYRELNSKKLFWISLFLTLGVVLVLALPSNNERGISVFGLTMDAPVFSTKALSHKGFYIELFSTLGIGWWLTWGATILALISTAGMIPDLVSGGTVDLILSKPIGRLRLFLTKYVAGLLFVALQASVFVVGAFLVIGVRGEAWRPSILLAVPIIVAFYSYLFCICAMIGMTTRSTMASLLGTLLIWLCVFGVGSTEAYLLSQSIDVKNEIGAMEGRSAALGKTISAVDQQIEALRKLNPDAESPREENPELPPKPAAATAAAPQRSTEPNKVDAQEQTPGHGPFQEARRLRGIKAKTQALMDAVTDSTNLEALRHRHDELVSQRDVVDREITVLRDSSKTTSMWHQGFYIGKAFLPKTTETTSLFDRYAVDPKDREGMFAMLEQQKMIEERKRETEEALRARSLWWVLGTSMAFETLVLGCASWMFCRRDF